MFRRSGALVSLVAATFAMSGSAYPSLVAAEAGGNPWWLWIIVFFVLAGFAAFMLWWWVRGAGEEVGVAPPSSTQAVPQEAAGVAPQARPPAQEDDLKRIEGIGPKIDGVLKEAGIRSFGQLASSDAQHIRQILQKADPNLPRLADPTSWPEQARLAAEGRWADLAKLQAELKGGRRK